MNFLNGSTRILLNGTEIEFQKLELVCHHKGDYDYETFKAIKFSRKEDAEYMYREMRDIYDHGVHAGKFMAKDEINDKIRKALKD